MMHKGIAGCIASLSENELTTNQDYQSLGAQCIKKNSTSTIKNNIIAPLIDLSCNGRSYAVMMATSIDNHYFVKYFGLREGVTPSLYGLKINYYEKGIKVQIQTASQAFVKLKQHKKTMQVRKACSSYTIKKLQKLNKPLKKLTPTDSAWVINGEIIATFKKSDKHNVLDKLLSYLSTAQFDTTPAIKFANEIDLTLVSFCRGIKHAIYAQPQPI